MKRNSRHMLTILCVLLSLVAPEAFAGISSWYQTFDRSMVYDLSQSYDMVDISWSSGNVNDNLLLGVLGCDDISEDQYDGEAVTTYSQDRWDQYITRKYLKSYIATINSSNAEMKLRTSQDAAAFRDFYIECCPRYEVSGRGDLDYGTSGHYESSGSYYLTPNKKFLVLQNGSVSVEFEIYGKHYGEVHMDMLFLLPSSFSTDDLAMADDYFANIDITIEEKWETSRQAYRWNGGRYVENGDAIILATESGALSVFPLTVGGYYNTDAPGGVNTYQFNVEPAALASYYNIKTQESMAYQPIASVKFFTPAKSRRDANSAYGLVLSASSDWTNRSETFAFTHMNDDDAPTIPFLCYLKGTGTSVGIDSQSDLAGDEAIDTSLAQSETKLGKMLRLKQTSMGGGYYRYAYEADLMAKVSVDDVLSDTSKYKAGLYGTNVYVHLVAL